MKYIKYLLILFLLSPIAAYAAPDLSMFQLIYKPDMPELIKPTVVNTILPGNQSYGVVVFEDETGIPQPWIAIDQYQQKEVSNINIEDISPTLDDEHNFIDNNYDTFAEFDLDQDKGRAFIKLEYQKAITSESLSLYLDNHVALPHTISISAMINSKMKTIVAETRLDNSKISFPETTSQNWLIEFRHGQPLRLREISLNEKTGPAKKMGTEIRWLARPDMTYTIYSDARLYNYTATAEAGKLSGDDLKVLKINLGDPTYNPDFREPDKDSDGIIDIVDNCINISNYDQKDIDDNGRGDVCEDFDGDEVINSIDNCPNHPNVTQSDIDADGIGDICDKDESRLTEKLPWLTWTAMGVSALIVIFILAQTMRSTRKKD